jgi:hypothetical protein
MTTPWQEVRALAEKATAAETVARHAKPGTMDARIADDTWHAARAELSRAAMALIRDPAFIGMMEDAARYRVLRNRTGDGWMSADAPQGESLDRLLDAEIWRINLAARASSAGEGE